MERPPSTPPTAGEGGSPAADAGEPTHPGRGGARPASGLDLSKLSPPGELEETRLEPFTIDGICGVY